MKLERTLLTVATIAFFGTLGAWLLVFAKAKVTADPADWSAFGSFLGGVLSPILAFASFVGLLLTLQQQRDATQRTLDQAQQASKLSLEQQKAEVTAQQTAEDDRNYFDHCISCLERAFAVLSDKGTSIGPVQDRLAWLTCARLLLASAKTAKQISPQSIGLLAILAGEQEHWRYRFYELFHQIEPAVGQQEHFFEGPGKLAGFEIDERSIRVIFEFVQWPEDKTDSIAEVPKYTLDELGAMKITMAGVREFVRPKAERRAR
jgi:hypothetical protein